MEGSLQRRKVYVLTEKGKGAALRVRNRVASAVIRLKDESGVREVAIAELLPWVNRSRSLLEIVREAIETGAVNLET